MLEPLRIASKLGILHAHKKRKMADIEKNMNLTFAQKMGQ